MDRPDDVIVGGLNLGAMSRHINAYRNSWPSIEGLIVADEAEQLIRIVREMVGKPEEAPDDSAFRPPQEPEEDGEGGP